MIEKAKYFYSLKTTKILTIILLSFFLFIALNLICTYVTSVILERNFTKRPYIYGRSFLCKKNPFKMNAVFILRALLKMSIFISTRTLFFYMVSKIKNSFIFKDKYTKSLFYTVIMTDFVYVILHFLFSSESNWDFYFYSSYFIKGGLFLLIPSWVFFGISVVINIIVFRKNINDFVDLTKYCLFAFLSFFVQLGITYIVFGKIFYKI